MCQDPIISIEKYEKSSITDEADITATHRSIIRNTGTIMSAMPRVLFII